MLASVTVAASATVGVEGTHAYAYDALGRRVSKTVGGAGPGAGTTVFAQLTLPIPPLGTVGGQVLAEYAAGAAATSPDRSYAFGSYCDDLLHARTTSTSVYFHHQGNLSIVAVTGALGEALFRFTYDSSGHRSVPEDNEAARHALTWGLTGRHHEQETGLISMRTRRFSPTLGRFIARDAGGFVDGYNTYRVYFLPGSLDPSGMSNRPGFGKDSCWQIMNNPDKIKDLAKSLMNDCMYGSGKKKITSKKKTKDNFAKQCAGRCKHLKRTLDKLADCVGPRSPAQQAAFDLMSSALDSLCPQGSPIKGVRCPYPKPVPVPEPIPDPECRPRVIPDDFPIIPFFPYLPEGFPLPTIPSLPAAPAFPTTPLFIAPDFLFPSRGPGGPPMAA